MVKVNRRLVGELESMPPIPVYAYTLILTGLEYSKLEQSGVFDLEVTDRDDPPNVPDRAWLEFGGLE